MAIREILLSDKLESGFRVKYNETILEIIIAGYDNGNGELVLQKDSGAVIVIDLKDSFYLASEVDTAIGNAINALYRANDTVAATGTLNQRIDYSSALAAAVRPDIKDYAGLGVILVAYDAAGFNIDSMVSGNFGYSTILNK
jgi:hypothetical protein